MKVHVETISPVEKKVTVEVDSDRVTQELDRAYAGLGRRVKLKGFRPGKAPRQVLERHFKEQVENEVIQVSTRLDHARRRMSSGRFPSAPAPEPSRPTWSPSTRSTPTTASGPSTPAA